MPGDKVITSSYESFGNMERLVLKWTFSEKIRHIVKEEKYDSNERPKKNIHNRVITDFFYCTFKSFFTIFFHFVQIFFTYG